MEQKNLHYWLMLAFQHSNHAITAETGKWDLLPGQPKILEFLLEHNGCTQKEIVKGCALDKSTVTSLLSRMEGKKLVQRRPLEHDRRHTLVFLTEEGAQWAKRTVEICAEVDRMALMGIPPEELSAFLATFQKILSNLEKMEEHA